VISKFSLVWLGLKLLLLATPWLSTTDGSTKFSAKNIEIWGGRDDHRATPPRHFCSLRSQFLGRNEKVGIFRDETKATK
jgi:hypothetical protein